jgi:glycine/D-amino acid oxidase-like deaminating enzyme
MTEMPIPGSQRSWWLREALAAEGDPDARPPLATNVDCDVAIVGGGYTGMWTAYQLTERAPGIRIALLEQDICGGGPSGRNGGFVHGWWEGLSTLVRRHGREAALRIVREADRSAEEIGAFCVRHDVDAEWSAPGYLRVSATPAHDASLDHDVELAASLREQGHLVRLTAAEVQERCASPAFRGGVLMRPGASVQPALLARGLRRVLLERGVAIHEGTRVRSVQREGRRMSVSTDGGSATADHVVLALNAWAAGWRQFASRLISWGSYIVLTESIPDRLAQLGWTNGLPIADSRFTVRYFRTTADGRIAFGAGVGRAGFGGRIGPSFTQDTDAVRRVVAGFRRLFPDLADVRLVEAWGGPIDVSGDRLPLVGSLDGGRVHYAHGYSGNGVGPAHLAGRILAALVDGGTDPIARLAIVGHRGRRFPPEPFRYVGARLLREALIRVDDAEEAGRRPAAPLRLLTRLPRLLGYELGHGSEAPPTSGAPPDVSP